MKIDSIFGFKILRMILCSGPVLPWLKEEAKKSDTPIDDTAIRIIEGVLCGDDEE